MGKENNERKNQRDAEIVKEIFQELEGYVKTQVKEEIRIAKDIFQESFGKDFDPSDVAHAIGLSGILGKIDDAIKWGIKKWWSKIKNRKKQQTTGVSRIHIKR